MSRLEFRASVAAPRPPSAWVMSLVASATLWITGELALWVIPVQLLAYGFSYYTRLDPPAWRRSPIWLNVGMLGITSITISQALHGSPAALSLAYFAALSQGLQLMDARPRRSEFLLVALALFQVILAANLTDSVFYPPLLVVFLVSVTWTLLVHTLRTEAAETGDAQAANRAISAELLRTTLIASGVSILLALVLFTVLPRLRSNMLRGALGSSLAVAGFNDSVSLGAIGRIRKDHRVVLRVDTLEGQAPAPRDAYWRGLTFDRFDGRSWTISGFPGRRSRNPVSGSPRWGVDLSGGPSSDALVQRIVREPVKAGVLFGAGMIRRVEGPLDHLQVDANGGLYFPSRSDERIRYTLWTEQGHVDDQQLRQDRSIPPAEHGPAARQPRTRYLSLPELDPAVAALAEQITASLTSDAERLRALEHYLRSQGRYTDRPPDLGPESGRSPVEDFLLGELAGHCEYFASAMVVLARSLGMPARLVNGFAGGRVNRIGGFTELTRSDAHAWVEVHYADAGWVRYDPTPPDLRLRGAGDLSLGERLAELASVIELWWFQRVVDFDSSDQMLALKSGWHFFKDLRSRMSAADGSDRAGSSSERWQLSGEIPWTALLLAVLLALLAAEVVRRRQPRGANRPLPVIYARALRLLARKGLRRAENTTARGFVHQVARQLPAPATACFARITEAYLAERFGDRSPGASHRRLEHDLEELTLYLQPAYRSGSPLRRDDAQRAPYIR